MRTEDGYIVRRVLNGEPEAFGLLVDRYKASIYAFAYVKLRNFHDAEDVAQEVFIKAYQKLRELRRYDSFLAWLYSIASDLCRKFIRAQSKRPDREFIEDQEPEVRAGISTDPYHDDAGYEFLHEALDSLPEMYRQVLTLYYLGGMTCREIARFLGKSPTAVRQRLSRARVQLREEVLAMTRTTFEGQRLQASFTFRIVEAVRRIKVHPMPRMAGLPWGLSLAAGIIITVMSLNPHIALQNPASMPAGSPLSVEAKVLKTGEIPVDILEVSQMPLLASMQGKGDDERPDQQEITSIAAQGQGGTWAKKADMQTVRDIFSACVMDGEIYAVGGNDDDREPLLSTIEKYNPEVDIWTKVADMPAPRCMHSLSVINGKIYVIGGAERVATIRHYLVLVYDPAKDEWAEKGKTPVEVANHCSAVVNGKIYVIGGTDVDNNAVSRVYEYDPQTDTWARKADMLTARHSAAAGVVNGKIYIIGGGAPQWPVPNGLCHNLSTVEEYDPVTDKWTTKADMPTARSAVAGSCCVLDGKIYVIGGWRKIGLFADEVEEYNPETDTWKRMADMPTARGFLCSVAVNGKIYAIGGRELGAGGIGTARILSTVEEYTPEGLRAVSPQLKLPTKWGEVK